MLVLYFFKINHIRDTENRRVDTLSYKSNYIKKSKLEATSIL